MPTSKTGDIFGLIAKVMADVGPVGKDRENTFHKYKFRGIDDVYNALHPALVKHGVFCAPEVINVQAENGTNDKGKASKHILLTIRHTFYAASDGSSLPVTTIGEGVDSGDKAANKAMSAAYKYALFELFCIPTKELKDSENESPAHDPQPQADSPTLEGIQYNVTWKLKDVQSPLGVNDFLAAVVGVEFPDRATGLPFTPEQLTHLDGVLSRGEYDWYTGQKIPNLEAPHASE